MPDSYGLNKDITDTAASLAYSGRRLKNYTDIFDDARVVAVENNVVKTVSERVATGTISDIATAGTGGTLSASTLNGEQSVLLTVGSGGQSSADVGMQYVYSTVDVNKRYEVYLTAAAGNNITQNFQVQVIWRTSANAIISTIDYPLGTLTNGVDRPFRANVGTAPANAGILMVRLRASSALPANSAFHMKNIGILDVGTALLGKKGTIRRGIGTNASIFNPTTNIFKMRTDLWTNAIHPDSANIVKGLTDQITPNNSGNVNMNLRQFNSNTYFVDENTPRIKVEWVPWRTGEIKQPLWGTFADSVPWPRDARPSEGTDRAINIYNPKTRELWEFWKVRPKPGYSGSVNYYNASYIEATGGEMQASYAGYISDARQSRGHFATVNGVFYGVAATSISYMGCAVTIDDVLSGEINHALALQTINNASFSNFYWPALRSDGNGNGVTFQGQRFRFPASIDFNSSTYNNLSPLAKMVCKAIQKYGMIITDTAGTVSLVGESGAIGIQSDGKYKDPWGAILTSHGSGLRAYDVLRNIPWASLEAMPANWGQSGEATIDAI